MNATLPTTTSDGSRHVVVLLVYVVTCSWVVIASLYLNRDAFVFASQIHIERLVLTVLGSAGSIGAGAGSYWWLSTRRLVRSTTSPPPLLPRRA